MAASRVKGDVAVLAVLRKGPASPSEVEKAMGHSYTSKMMWWLKACGYKIDTKKDKNRVVSFTLVSETGAKVLEPKAEKVAPAPKAPVVAKPKKFAKPVVQTEVDRKVPAPKGRIAANKAPSVPKPRAKTEVMVPLSDDVINAGNYTVDNDFDNDSMDDVLKGLGLSA